MMKWITGITLNNYRAFVKSEIIDIPQDQHLLIYGENGSGKSSVYNALKDFFNSSFTSSNTIFNEARILANSSVWSMTARNSSK